MFLFVNTEVARVLPPAAKVCQAHLKILPQSKWTVIRGHEAEEVIGG